MAVQTATTLKGYFNTGDTPTEAQFADLIDSSINTGLLDKTAHDALDHTGLTGIPAAYSLPTASTTVLGGVKVDGTTVTITDGVISSTATGGADIPYQNDPPSNPADGDLWVDKDAIASGSASLLVAETVVSGNTTNNVSFTSLDSSLTGGYRIEVIHVSGSPGGIGRMYINGDTTNTHYYNQFFYADGTTIAAARSNDITIISNDSNLPGFSFIDIVVSTSRAMGWFQLGRVYNNGYCNNGIWQYTQTLTNGKITQIDLRAYAEDNRYWPTGTIFRLYRRK